MKEINAIISAYRSMPAGTAAAMATLVRLEGSSYRRMGARMLVTDDGRYVGGISGGCLEGDALLRAQKTIVKQKASVVTYDTTRSDGAEIGLGLGCNGIIDVMFSPVNPELIESLEQIAASRKPELLVTAISGKDVGTSVRYTGASTFVGLEEIIANRRSTIIEQEGERFFAEVILPQVRLIIFGGHHDVISLVRVAGELGWHTTVVMNLLKVDRQLNKLASSIIDRNAEELPIPDEFSAVVLMSHDFKTDKKNLLRVISTPAFYIGILGPRNRTERMYAESGEEIPEQDRYKIYSPAGLDIGANTPEEIALSIVAEIRAQLAGRTGESLRQRKGTIYERQETEISLRLP